MARFERFTDVQRLSDAELRLLFEDGEAVQRLWAAWALGMRREPDMPALMHRATAREPSAGVRAHFALMLVSHGEIDAAAALARFDPAAIVRAAACRHLARVAKPGDALNELLLERLSDPDADVLIALVDGLREDAPRALVSRCEDLLEKANDAVRAAAIESILRRTAIHGVFPARLLVHVRTEPSDDLVMKLLDAWRDAEGLATLVDKMSSWESHHVMRVLTLARRGDERLLSSELDVLFARREPEILHALCKLAATARVDAPLLWLVDVTLTGLGSAWSSEAWHAGTIAISMIAELVERTDRASLSEKEGPALARLREAFEQKAAVIAGEAKIGVDSCVAWTRGERVEEAALACITDYLEWEEFIPELLSKGIALLPKLRALSD